MLLKLDPTLDFSVIEPINFFCLSRWLHSAHQWLISVFEVICNKTRDLSLSWEKVSLLLSTSVLDHISFYLLGSLFYHYLLSHLQCLVFSSSLLHSYKIQKKTPKKPFLSCGLSSPIALTTLELPLSSQLAYWSHLSQTLSLFTPQYSSANNCSRFFPNASLNLCSLKPEMTSQQSFPVITSQSSPSLTPLEDVVVLTSSTLLILAFLTVLSSLWPLFSNLCYLSSSAPCFMLDSRAGPYLFPILSLLSPPGCDFIHSSAFCWCSHDAWVSRTHFQLPVDTLLNRLRVPQAYRAPHIVDAQ